MYKLFQFIVIISTINKYKYVVAYMFGNHFNGNGMGLGIANGLGTGKLGLRGGSGVSSMNAMGGLHGMSGINLLGSSQSSSGALDKGHENMNDLFFNKAFGNQDTGFYFGQSGIKNSQDVINDLKGNMGYWNSLDGAKNLLEDQSGYHGIQTFGKHGGNKLAAKTDKGQKKGHTVKGFQTSHQTDENSNTEEVYDEAMDEADKKAYKGEEGKFTENTKDVVKEKKSDVKFDTSNGNQQGNYANNYLADKSKAENKNSAGNKFTGDNSFYGVNNGGNLHDQVGHQESNKFSNHYPIHY